MTLDRRLFLQLIPAATLPAATVKTRLVHIVEFDAAGKVVHQLKNIPWSVTSVALMK